MLSLDYPILFEPILHERIWGGTKLNTALHKRNGRSGRIGESWEISDVPGNISVVKNGPLAGANLKEVIETFGPKLLGSMNYQKYGNRFPLLIKFLDADSALSVQLHPCDELAKQRHNCFGKTEMWYIVEAEDEAKLVLGFRKGINKSRYLKKTNQGKLKEILNEVNVSSGDAFFIPAGLVHAIGPGCLIAEIQQTSDVTYRLYDWDRVDIYGKSRELHTELALEAIDFGLNGSSRRSFPKQVNAVNEVVDCPYFTTNHLKVLDEHRIDHSDLDSFVIYMCVAGEGRIRVGGRFEKVKKGNTVLVSASSSSIEIEGEIELLEIYN